MEVICKFQFQELIKILRDPTGHHGFVVKTAGREAEFQNFRISGVRSSGVQESVGKSNCGPCGSLCAPRETRIMYDEPINRMTE